MGAIRIVLYVAVVAASIIMDMMQRILVKEGEKEVQDIFRGGEGGKCLSGFGGGGGLHKLNKGPGGGGGYTGGSGGANDDISCGGGGGSFNNGTNQQNEYCNNSAGHGWVNITFLR